MEDHKPIYKELTISTVTDILRILKNYPDLGVFRGQSLSSWSLIPRLYRMFEETNTTRHWPGLESSILSDFRQHSLPYLKREPKNDFEWLVTGQHYGLPTRLLDWTSNPLKATFFAVSDNIEEDGALFALAPTCWIFEVSKEGLQSDRDQLVVTYPNAIDVRVIAQESVFTVFPLRNDSSMVLPLEDVDTYGRGYYSLIKMKIPSSVKIELQADLDRLGVNRKTLFPDLSGLADYLHWRHAPRGDESE